MLLLDVNNIHVHSINFGYDLASSRGCPGSEPLAPHVAATVASGGSQDRPHGATLTIRADLLDEAVRASSDATVLERTTCRPLPSLLGEWARMPTSARLAGLKPQQGART